MTESCFSDLGLADPILRALTARNHVVPTPIQAQAIPELLAGRDVLGIAQTGTGKTGAFALPILHQLSRQPGKKGPRGPRAVILAPTRELAIQIGEEVRAYGGDLHMRQALIYGGVSQRPQVTTLARGVDIVIATPGRLLDLMNQRRVRMDSVQFLVLDEADRMLDMGFVHDVRKIVAAMPHERQSLLFSATMPRAIARLSGEMLSDPIRVEVAPQSTPVETIEQTLYHVPAARKTALLAQILDDPAMARVIVFSRTKHRANRVADDLTKRGFSAEAIHGNKSQAARQRALKRFKAGDVRILVATDIAARGIDVDGVTHVVNFEIPNEPESYVHRIGRTARAGAAGAAVSFCDTSERGYVRDIERLIRFRLTVVGDAPESNDRPQNTRRDDEGERRNTRPANGKPRNGDARKASPHKGKSGDGTPARGRFHEDRPRDGESRDGDFRKAKPYKGKPGEGTPGKRKPGNGSARDGESRDGDLRKAKPYKARAADRTPGDGAPRKHRPKNGPAGDGGPREGQFRKAGPRASAPGKPKPHRKGGHGRPQGSARVAASPRT